MKKTGLFGALVAATLIVTGALSSAQAQQPQKVRFLMDWVLGGKHAVFYPAVEKGFYKEEGLDVEVLRGTGSDETVQAVDQGHAEFGFADAGVMTLKSAQGAKVRYLGAVFDNQPMQFIALASSNINEPKDFIGKRYGSSVSSMATALFPLFMRQNGIDPKQVETVNVELTAAIAALFSGKVDITSGYSNSGTPIAWSAAVKENRPVVTIPAGKYGLDIYSNGVITSAATIEKNPELVRKFMRATYRGLKYAVENPEEALEILFKRHPEIRNKEIAIAQFREALKDFLTPAALANGLGYLDPVKWQRTRDFIFEGYNAKTDIPAKDLYTSEFLPVVKVDKMPTAFLEKKVFGRY